jgi:hypothetical protein
LNKWESDFAQAVAALEAAYDNDRRIYAALVDDTKSTWALQPMPVWPEPMGIGAMAEARAALIEAENAVRAIVQRRSVAIRHARDRRTAMYERSAFAPTMPLVLEPGDARLLAKVRESDISWPARLG